MEKTLIGVQRSCLQRQPDIRRYDIVIIGTIDSLNAHQGQLPIGPYLVIADVYYWGGVW